jgi:SAM-dependent methyltransferase
MHHMPDRWHVLRQAARVLRPGGRIAIGDFVLVPGADGARPDPERVREASKGVLTVIEIDEYVDHLREAGFEPTSTRDVSRFTQPSWGKAAVRFEALRAQAEPHIGAEQFDLTMSRFTSFSAEPTLGYALLTARKPD